MTKKNIENKQNNEFMINIDQDQIQSFSFKNTLKELNNNDANIHENFKNDILKKYPKLNTLNTQLYLDWYSKLENIKPFLEDLANLPQTTLEKIKKYKNRICISDRPVTARSTNNDLTWTPRWRDEWYTRDNVWWIYRNKQKTVYIWRSKINWQYITWESTAIHELWHMFDYESSSRFFWYKKSQTKEFKNFHKLFYNKLASYFQQDWPWWEAWCSEFFAEACYQIFERWEQKFTNYYSTELCNYMKKILI